MHSSRARADYASPWLVLDVRPPAGPRLRVPKAAVGVLVEDPERARVLLIWRHRFIVGSWGYEVPAGAVEPGESIEEAARRETLEETGWHISGARLLLAYEADPDLGSQRLHIAAARAAGRGGDPPDLDESTRCEWLDPGGVAEVLRDGRVSDGLTQIALTYWLLTRTPNLTGRTGP